MDIETARLNYERIGMTNTFGLDVDKRKKLNQEYEKAQQDYFNALMSQRLSSVSFGSHPYKDNPQSGLYEPKRFDDL